MIAQSRNLSATRQQIPVTPFKPNGELPEGITQRMRRGKVGYETVVGSFFSFRASVHEYGSDEAAIGAAITYQRVATQLLPRLREQLKDSKINLNQARAEIRAALNSSTSPEKPETMLANPAPSPAPETQPGLVVINGGAPQPVTETKRRIRWHRAEIDAMAARVAELCREQGWRAVPQTRDGVGRSLLAEMTDAAQVETLAKDRRKLGTPPSMLPPELWRRVSKALANPVQPPPAKTNTPPVNRGDDGPAPSKPSALEAPAAAGQAPAPAPTAAELELLDPLAHVPTVALIRAAASRLFGIVATTEAMAKNIADVGQYQNLLTDELALVRQDRDNVRRELAELRTLVQALQPTKSRLPRVAFVGCWKHEFDHIVAKAEAAGIKADWRHYDQDSAVRRIDAEWCISWRFVGHHWEESILKTIPRSNYAFLHTGGISKAVAQLQTWFLS